MSIGVAAAGLIVSGGMMIWAGAYIGGTVAAGEAAAAVAGAGQVAAIETIATTWGAVEATLWSGWIAFCGGVEVTTGLGLIGWGLQEDH